MHSDGNGKVRARRYQGRKEQEYGDLKAAIEKAFSAERVTKFLKALESRGIRVRNLDAVLTTDAIDAGAGNKAGTARSLHSSLPISDSRRCGSFISRRLKKSTLRFGQSFTSCISTTEWISGRRLICETAGNGPALQRIGNGERKI